MKGRILIVAGSDSSGGAGIQADIKTVTALRGYAATAITALTAQNTGGVSAVEKVSPSFVIEQMRMVIEDIGVDAVKTGMLADAATIEAVAWAVRRYAASVPLVVDPVMIAQSGARLVEDTALDALEQGLLPLATVITPNVPEAEALWRQAIPGTESFADAASALRRRFGGAVLLKGGHLAGDPVRDLLVDESGEQWFGMARVATRHTHGTGCTLASAIATGLGQGLALPVAVGRARRYLQEALARAPGFGHGQGPVDHGHTVRPFH